LSLHNQNVPLILNSPQNPSLFSLQTKYSLTSSNNTDNYRNKLLEHVSEALENSAFLSDKHFYFPAKRGDFLRGKGHDAVVCVAAWEAYDGTVTAGSHEFIDVAVLGGFKLHSRRFRRRRD
jgi:hypothetical protein